MGMNNQTSTKYAEGIIVSGAITSEFAEILTPDAMNFLAFLARTFEDRRTQLLQRRLQRQLDLDAGRLPDFLPETEHIRDSSWTIAPIPADIHDRRVEITGPVERKMVINALNSGARVFMADFEDAHSPTWEATIQGQINVRDAIRRTIQFSSPEGKEYKLAEKIAVLFIRPRGWHLEEKHVLIDGKPIAASLFDFGLYFFHNIQQLLANGSGPYERRGSGTTSSSWRSAN
jgi:malate synthase